MSIDLHNPPVRLHWAGMAPGTGGGVIKQEFRDFVVEEIPKYEPAGSGPFHYLWIEKEDVSGPMLVRELSRRLRIRPRDIGCAGMKDRRAITRQWISVPDTVDLAGIDGPVGQTGRITLLRHERHGNKLRTGHLHGNRFLIRIRGRDPEDDPGIAEALTSMETRGLINVFGAQRFSGGTTVDIGLAAFRGERAGDRRMKRLGVSALQAAVFNHWAAARADLGLLERAVAGDVLKKVVTGGIFVSEDPAVDSERIAAGELVVTGPLFGAKYRESCDRARDIEDEVLSESGITRELMAASKRLAPGSRRPVVARIGTPRVERDPDGVVLQFTLPAGSYATVVVALACGIDAEDGHGARP